MTPAPTKVVLVAVILVTVGVVVQVVQAQSAGTLEAGEFAPAPASDRPAGDVGVVPVQLFGIALTPLRMPRVVDRVAHDRPAR